ncbi:tRNA lysidine(34) synthetase TilS [Patescibacteria group bacterium]|nr:tRNA lysidine(34) synthetase TilS [Patescibacteria group bacterium]
MNKQESKKLEKKVLNKLSSIIAPSHAVVVGISGGSDSVFLLELLNRIPCKIIVAHINHNLRGADSQKDQDFCEKLAKNYKNIFELKSAKLPSKNLEEAGRKSRYEFFRKLAKKYKAQFILTAHHADDNLETILLNLTRGASLKGLTGMEELSDNLFRPLLNISKKEILDYLKTHHLTHREDKSNKDLKFTRNFLRHQVIPLLQQINPNLATTSAKNSQNLREIQDFLEQEAKKWIGTKKSYNLKEFRTLSPALQNQIIIEIYKKECGNSQNIEQTHIKEVLKMLLGEAGNKEKKLGGITFYKKSPGIFDIS